MHKRLTKTGALLKKQQLLGKNKRVFGVVLVLFAGLATLLLFMARAATDSVVLETETSTLSGDVSVIDDADASGGKALHFGRQPDTPPVVDPPTNPDTGDDGIPRPTGGQFELGQVPFRADSSWNTKLGSNVTYSHINWPANRGGAYYINWERYTPAIYVSKPSDPAVRVRVPATWGWPAMDQDIRIPEGVTGADGTDGEIVIIDGTTVYNFWQFHRSGNSATASAQGRTDLIEGNGWGTSDPWRSAGITATGHSMIAGMLIEAETNRGDIHHALAIALDFSLQAPGYVGEAIGGDGTAGSSAISVEGRRMGIPPDTPLPSEVKSDLGKKVFKAMKEYGVFNIDVSGGTGMRAQNNAYDGDTIGALRGEIGHIIPLLHHVD